MKPYPVIFLDVDGVVNGSGPRQFEPDCIRELNRILAVTEAKVVISSSCRQLMIDQDGARADMTVSGFTTMLRTHGILGLEILGHIGPDTDTRGALIRKWLKENRNLPISRYVVIDDCDHDITAESLPFVQTDGSKGLTVESADQVIRVLNRGMLHNET